MPHRPRAAAALALTLVLVVAGFLLWRLGLAPGSAREMPRLPPVSVAAESAERATWNTQLSAVGTLRAERGVDVTAAAAGIVTEIRFDSGDEVKRGELIAVLDTDADRARLATLRAQLEQARTDLNRLTKLLGQGAVAVADREEIATQVATLRAQVAEQRALIDRKRIEAPFSGKLGIRRVDLGQFVQPGDPVVTLQQIQPLLVDFALPERHYGALESGQPIKLMVDAWPDRRFEGVVSAIDPRIDEGTRNFNVQGKLENAEGLLRPGMFANLTVTLPDARQVVSVPVDAISYSPSGDSVFLVEKDEKVSTATRVPVTAGERRGALVAVQGIEPGDVVVTAGQMKLFEGARVSVAPDRMASAARSPAR